MKLVGLACGGHDTAYCVFENGETLIHEEYERFSRIKEQRGDILQFVFDRQKDLNEVKYFIHFFTRWGGGLKSLYPESFQKLESLMAKTGAKFLEVSHHTAHAANAFFSSNFEESLIISIDGGGEETLDGTTHSHNTAFALYYGKDNKVNRIIDFPFSINIGWQWDLITQKVFNLSSGPPKGNQCGTVMGMAAVAKNYEKYIPDMRVYIRSNNDERLLHKWTLLSEEEKFDLAGALQKCTEEYVIELIRPYIEQYKPKNICMVGGVALNGLLNSQILEEFNCIENIYIPPVPYDAGLAIGCCQYVYFHLLNNPREINTRKNTTPYLGVNYTPKNILSAIESENVLYKKVTNKDVIELLANQYIVSIFNDRSESGRRALGNRSIFADPRQIKIKDIINTKVKHRQWFRPFAPIILQECMKDWFVRDLESPYMNIIVQFLENKKQLVPGVVHYDGTGRVQTVKREDNQWLYEFLKEWYSYTGVPLLLNTSFNDREPIVETPTHAIHCFKKTNIDYLYFPEIDTLIYK